MHSLSVSKADRSELDACLAAVRETRAASLGAHAELQTATSATTALSADFNRFREEAQHAIQAATRAANEARLAVNACFSTAALAEPSVTDAAVAGVQSALAEVQEDVRTLREVLQHKADTSAVNDVLETKANKSTVAQALHKKVSSSHNVCQSNPDVLNLC